LVAHFTDHRAEINKIVCCRQQLCGNCLPRRGNFDPEAHQSQPLRHRAKISITGSKNNDVGMHVPGKFKSIHRHIDIEIAFEAPVRLDPCDLRANKKILQAELMMEREVGLDAVRPGADVEEGVERCRPAQR
jgi:hypothetical protein